MLKNFESVVSSEKCWQLSVIITFNTFRYFRHFYNFSTFFNILISPNKNMNENEILIILIIKNIKINNYLL